MSGKTQLRSILILCLLAIGITSLASVRPLAAETNAFSLTLLVDPAGKGTATADPLPPYSNNQVVTLTATPIAGWVFDKWVVAGDGKWWNNDWDYRVEVKAAAAGFARKDKPAEFALNFTQIWNSLGTTGTLDPNSIRVVEVDADDNVIDEAVSFQFDKAVDFNASTKAAGQLVLIMKGDTAAGAERRYQVYFDVTGKGFAPPNVPAQVTVTPDVIDAGQKSFKLETPIGTYFLHNLGAGFSSLNDVDGNDWISYSDLVVGEGGTFRGIPNIVLPNNGGHFHPGSKSMVTTLRNQGPIKVTIHVIEKKATTGREKWQGIYEIYPEYTTFTMLVAPYDYWFLYEGTPGGSLQPATDFVVRNDGTQTPASQAWEGDLVNEEWAYVADPTVGRSIYFANHIDDTVVDSYAQAGGVMTKLGLGRQAAKAYLAKTLVPRKFTFGLMDETAYDNAKPIVYNAYRDLNVTVGAAKARGGATLGSQNPVQFTITGEHTITAMFKPAQYTVTVGVSPNDVGTVTRTPDKATYDFGEQVTLAAAPTQPGYNFTGWQGDVTGTTNPVTVEVTKNMVATATFAQSFTVTTSANPVEGGTVTVDPLKATYQPGEVITVTAVANNDYSFTGWSGDLSGTGAIQSVTVNGNKNIVANFGTTQFTFSATSAGNGTVDWAPKKDFYAAGEMVTVTATPAGGYSFASWSGDVTSTVNPLTLPINGNTAIVGNFVETQFYTVTVTVPGGGGTVAKNPDQATYPTGTIVTLTATPDANKSFVAWGGDASGTEPMIEVTVTANLDITATFADDLQPLNVDVVPIEGGTVGLNPPGGAYVAGTVVTLAATPNLGWTFTGWGGAVGGTTNPITVTVPAGGTDVIANFQSLGPTTLTVTTTGDGAGTVQKNPNKVEYLWGETVTLTAVPGSGSVFAGWSGDVTSNSNPLPLVMNGNKNIVARFIEPSGPFSDNFNACSLAPMWGAPINPLGDATFSHNGTQLRIAVPEGTDHNAWKDGNNTARVMQPADNTDFQVVTKFDSPLSQNSQLQGILVEQDAQNYIRFDFNYLNDTSNAYAAVVEAGVPKKRLQMAVGEADAVYLRVTRQGNTWFMAYSGNGTAWNEVGSFNFALNVQMVGVFAGNVGTKSTPAPAHAAVVDFFQNTAEGPMPEDAPLLGINIVGGGTVTTNPPLNQLACGQTVTLTAAPGVGWTFGGWSGDVTGTQTSASLLLTGPKSVTATFNGSGIHYLMLPMVIR